MNRLGNETSPYLKQHANQPVWWYPWGDEAFEKARKEHKPIFLSIGYSTCHWCHVMAAESFEDGEVAEILNTHFISIKLDREERPDVDSIYMEACQAVTGSGGWPLSIFLKEDKSPFFAGTYFPKEDQGGRAGFKTLLLRIASLWQNPEQINQAAQSITSYLQQDAAGGGAIQDLSETVFLQCQQAFDTEHGGLKGPIKFPMPQNIFFLLRYYQRYGEPQALLMAEKNLHAMYMGGLYDHVGGGFCRYATDSKWQIPHFEKMLYDNALLAVAYTECYQITRKSLYEKIVAGIFGYMEENLQDKTGLFYTAQDADSEGREGAFYAFTEAELNAVLGGESAIFRKTFPYSAKGNFEGANILFRQDEQQCTGPLLKLKQYRNQRPAPAIDTKQITALNAMALVAYSKAARAFHSEAYKKQAEGLAAALWQLQSKEGRFLRLAEGAVPAFGEDYAYLLWGLLEIYQATGEEQYLQQAQTVAEQYYDLFWDEKEGGFFLTGNDAEKLLKRPKETYDNAYPSYNSLSAQCFFLLFQFTGNAFYRAAAEKTLSFLMPVVKNAPLGSLYTATALLAYFSDNLLVHVAGDETSSGWNEINCWLDENFLPFCQICRKTEEYAPVDGETTLYICDSYSCKPPEKDLERIKKLLYFNNRTSLSKI